MTGLKTLVIVMGIAIIVGATVLATTVIQRGAGLDGAGHASDAHGVIHLPRGAEVMETHLDGERILLRVRLAGGAMRVVIVDARTGAPIVSHDLMPEGKTQ